MSIDSGLKQRNRIKGCGHTLESLKRYGKKYTVAARQEAGAHQIRVHMASIKLPTLVGDPLYGPKEAAVWSGWTASSR